MKEDLKKLGLTDNEIKVYLSLLKIGETPVGGIINDLKVHRQIAYNALDSLEQKNMVSKTTINKIQHYNISDPGNILENIKKQELIAKRIQENIKTAMKKDKHEQEINVYSGQAQIRNFYLSNYKNAPENSTMYGLYSFGNEYMEVMGIGYLKKIEKIRQKKHMLTRHLTSEPHREDILKTVNLLSTETREVRFLPHDIANPVSTIIWNNKVWFQSFFVSVPFIIEIKNENFYQTFINHFNALWKLGKK